MNKEEMGITNPKKSKCVCPIAFDAPSEPSICIGECVKPGKKLEATGRRKVVKPVIIKPVDFAEKKRGDQSNSIRISQ